MILIGIFSTHLTYLLLAAIYIFGYSAYTLNCKKNQNENLNDNPVKKITYNLSESKSSGEQEDCFYWKYDISDKLIADINESIKFNFNILKNIKVKKSVCLLFYHFYSYPDFTSRPPPFSV